MAETNVSATKSRLSTENYRALYDKKSITHGEYVNRQKALQTLVLHEDVDTMLALEANGYANCEEIVLDEMMKQAAATGVDLDEDLVKRYLSSTKNARDKRIKSEYATVGISAFNLYEAIGEQLTYCRIEKTVMENAEDDEYDYKLYNSKGDIVCDWYEDYINVLSIDKDGVVLVNEEHNDVELFRLSLEEAYVAGIELGEYEKYLSSYNPIAKQLMKHLADRDNTKSLPVENDKFVGMYSFVKYGEARLVYRVYELKTTDGQEYNPFTALSMITGKRMDMQLTGVVWGGTLFKLTDMYDPFIPQIPETTTVVSFDEQCQKFSEYATQQLQKQLGNDVKVMVTRDEYLDYLANKVDEKTLIKHCKARFILENMEVTDWWKDVNVYAKEELTRVAEECVIDGIPIATANIWLPANHLTYPVYIVKREDEDGNKVYDACIRDGDLIVPIAEDAVGFTREIDARHRGEIYFADIATAPCKPERGSIKPKRGTDAVRQSVDGGKDDVER